MRQFLSYLAIFISAASALALIIRWLISQRKKEDLALEAARKRHFEREELEAAKSREVEYETRYVDSYLHHLRIASGVRVDSNEEAEASASDMDLSRRSPTSLDDEVASTDSALDSMFGPNPESLRTSSDQIRNAEGPRFGTIRSVSDDGGNVCSYYLFEERSETKLTVQRGTPKNPKVWALSIHVPYLDAMSQLPRPRAFGQRGFEWTKTIPFTVVDPDDHVGAINELKSWFIRILAEQERPGSGNFTCSCADWIRYTRDPNDKGYRIIWVSRKEDDRFNPDVW